MNRYKTLLVEDDDPMRRLLETVLKDAGHAVDSFTRAEDAWEGFQKERDPLVVLDLVLPGMGGLEMCRNIRAHDHGPYCTVVVVTSKNSAEDLQAVLDAGADDYVAKPIEMKLFKVRLAIAERRVLDRTVLAEANERITLLEEQSKSRVVFEGLDGRSDAMQEVFRRIRLASESAVSVLILGESGTGKELAARAIHAQSARKTRPFLGINCSAIPETLLESELFGHVKGAFTGAIRDRAGVFRAADSGTLFLDEVGDMSPNLQVKLLRTLQEKEVQRVGDERPVKVDVRLICATNRDLPALLSSGAIREDFYYRIRVFEILIPPLRSRQEDVPLLVGHFISEFSRTFQKPVKGIDPQALRRMMEYAWPGNIRELRNAVERAFVTVTGDRIRLEDLPSEIRTPVSVRHEPESEDVLSGDDRQERERIISALQAAGGSRTVAAKQLGISRVTLWKKIRRFDIQLNSQT
ncbi:sigma-54-dependent Fis family transcriptional regulator [bacterium]|nr:sigma-54-dependent Fis family transcriptional regulator [bacterium]